MLRTSGKNYNEVNVESKIHYRFSHRINKYIIADRSGWYCWNRSVEESENYLKNLHYLHLETLI